MATLQDYLGITALRDAWPKWKANIIAVNNQLVNHVAGTADKHAAEKITYAGSLTSKTDVKAALDQAKLEIDTIVISASIDPEVALARDSAVKSKVFGSLDARLEEDEQDLVSHKAENTTLSLKKSLLGDVNMQVRKPEAVISFICDDGKLEDYTIAKPLFDSEGAHFCNAITSNLLNTDGYMTTEQALDLQDSGHEIMSHSRNHVHLAELTEEELDVELGLSRQDLMFLGLKADSIVYPAGDDNLMVREMARKYYRAGFDITFGYNLPSTLNTYKLNRIDLSAHDIIALKGYVDQAIADKSYLVFNFHTYASFDAEQQQMTRDLINYCQTQGVPILTANEALDRVGNLIDLKVYGDDGIPKRIRLSSNGDFTPEAVILTQNDFAISTTPVTSFKPIKRSITRIQTSNPDRENFPEGSAGELVTDRIGYDRQTFYVYQSHNVYDRYWTGSAWSEWRSMLEDKISSGNAYDASALIGSFPVGVTINTVSVSNVVGMPEPKAGTLLTTRVDENTPAYNYQIYHIYDSPNMYKRNVTTDGNWDAWRNLLPNIVPIDKSIVVGSMGTQTTRDVVAYSSAFNTVTTLTMNIKTLIPGGVQVTPFITEDGYCTLRFFNSTSGTVNCGTIDFRFITIAP